MAVLIDLWISRLHDSRQYLHISMQDSVGDDGRHNLLTPS